MTWEPRPVPPVTPETEPFWAGAAEGVFRIMRCQECGEPYFYPRQHCPFCFSDDVAWEAAEGTGEVYTYSVVGRVEDWPDDALPQIPAIVELSEGPRVITNIVDAQPADVEIGTSVSVQFVDTATDNVAIPVFAPAE